MSDQSDGEGGTWDSTSQVQTAGDHFFLTLVNKCLVLAYLYSGKQVTHMHLGTS